MSYKVHEFVPHPEIRIHWNWCLHLSFHLSILKSFHVNTSIVM